MIYATFREFSLLLPLNDYHYTDSFVVTLMLVVGIDPWAATVV
jgi:hypothetical protein